MPRVRRPRLDAEESASMPHTYPVTATVSQRVLPRPSEVGIGKCCCARVWLVSYRFGDGRVPQPQVVETGAPSRRASAESERGRRSLLWPESLQPMTWAREPCGAELSLDPECRRLG